MQWQTVRIWQIIQQRRQRNLTFKQMQPTMSRCNVHDAGALFRCTKINRACGLNNLLYLETSLRSMLQSNCSARQLLPQRALRCRAAPVTRHAHASCTAQASLRSTPQADTEKSALETAIDNARETCEGGATGECANAWDDVEELSAEMGHKRERAKENKKDVLEE